MRRDEALAALSERIAEMACVHPLRVAVDGIDAAGKTTLANELAPLLEARGRPVIRASIDGFHRPRAERYQRGPDSPEGYYLDAFDHDALRETLLLPLGPQGSGRYHRAVFDYRADSPAVTPAEQAPANAILLMDGVFLLRPELDALWDYRIWVETAFPVALERALRRDLHLFGSPLEIQARYLGRYFPGQRLYLETAHPHERADAFVRNNDPAHPRLTFSGEG